MKIAPKKEEVLDMCRPKAVIPRAFRMTPEMMKLYMTFTTLLNQNRFALKSVRFSVLQTGSRSVSVRFADHGKSLANSPLAHSVSLNIDAIDYPDTC